jgi:hypothetical protein
MNNRTAKEFKDQAQKVGIKIYLKPNSYAECKQNPLPLNSYAFQKGDESYYYSADCLCPDRLKALKTCWQDIANYYNSLKEPTALKQMDEFWEFDIVWQGL